MPGITSRCDFRSFIVVHISQIKFSDINPLEYKKQTIDAYIFRYSVFLTYIYCNIIFSDIFFDIVLSMCFLFPECQVSLSDFLSCSGSWQGALEERIL